MDCDFCRKDSEKDKSFYFPSVTDPREYHICIDCVRKWHNELEK